MKALTLALLLAVAIPATAQDPAPEAPALRALQFTLADVIDVLADYRVVHDSTPLFCNNYYGLTDYVARTITICAEMDLTFRRSTIIHEVLHVVSWRRSILAGEQYTEAEIAAATERIYQELYAQ